MQTASIDAAATMQAAVLALSKGEPARARDMLEHVISAQRADASTDAEKAAAQKNLAVARDLRRAQAYYASR